MAHRIVELESLPFGLSTNVNVKKVVEWYKLSVRDILLAPVPSNLAEEARWARMLEAILERHGPTLVSGSRASCEAAHASLDHPRCNARGALPPGGGPRSCMVPCCLAGNHGQGLVRVERKVPN